MPPRYLKGLAALAVGLMACQESPGSVAGALPPASQAVPTTSLLRLPRAGGLPRLYAAADLAELGWKARERMPALQRAIGFDLDQALAYAIDSSRGLQALDLTTATSRQLTQRVRGAALGPEGTLWVVDDKDGVVRIRHRLAKPTGTTLAAAPVALYGTSDRQLISIEGGDTARAVLVGETESGVSTVLPTTRTAASPWGDLLAIADPAGVEFWAPRGTSPISTVRVDGAPRSVRFSASGHRIFVARDQRGLAVIDRYAGERVKDIDLPGAAAALRVAPYGGWLLAKASEGDSVWIINLATNTYTATVTAPWDTDLPTVIGDATLLLRQDADIIALDLHSPELRETGRLTGAAADLYLPVPWSPEGTRIQQPVANADSGAATPRTPDSTRAGGPPDAGGGIVYLQVSRSQNPAWAQELAATMRDEGFPALVLTPRTGEEAFRVVVGPYPSREAAESAGRRLGRPSFIFQP